MNVPPAWHIPPSWHIADALIISISRNKQEEWNRRRVQSRNLVAKALTAPPGGHTGQRAVQQFVYLQEMTRGALLECAGVGEMKASALIRWRDRELAWANGADIPRWVQDSTAWNERQDDDADATDDEDDQKC